MSRLESLTGNDVDEKASARVTTSPKKQKASPSKPKPERAKKRQVIIVGIDFGTTYSGIAYVCTVDKHGDVQVLNEYSGGQLQSDVLEKVPTRLAYPFENGGKEAWGYQVKPGMVSYSWFKLMLDEETDLAEYDDPLLRQSAAMGFNKLPPGKDQKDVTADFLRYLYNHVMGKLTALLEQAIFDETPIHFHFTLPATWSPKARNLTREAAEIAGFGQRPGDKFFMLDEPEAAAIAAMKATIDAFPENNHFEVFRSLQAIPQKTHTHRSCRKARLLLSPTLEVELRIWSPTRYFRCRHSSWKRSALASVSRAEAFQVRLSSDFGNRGQMWRYFG